MELESNTPETGLDMDSAIAQLMGTSPSEEKAPEGTTDSEEVTQSEETVNTQEAAAKTPQKPKVDPEEQPAAEALTEDDAEEEAPDEEAEPEEEPEEGEESDADEDEQDSEDAEGEEEAEDDEPETLFQLDDGTEVDLDELKRGYLRQSDYTRKTQEVAEHRKALEQAGQQFVQSQDVLAENLNLALSVVEPQLAELAGTDWDALAQEDAYAYAEKRALFDQAQARYNKLMESAQQVVQAQKTQQQQQLQARLQQEAQKLQMAIPDFADPSKAKALKTKISEYAVEKVGLTESEAKGISDHRIILLLQKAMQFDELNEGGLSAAKKKVSKAPRRSIKSGQPTSRADKQKEARKQRMSRLKASGRTEDAVAALLG